MAYKVREEIVGKRFLSVSAYSTKLKIAKISEWPWRGGIIRAASHKDNTNKELQVLVEYDDREWERREWVSVYKTGAFHMFLIERTLVWCPHPTQQLAPALTFTALVGSLELSLSEVEPVEYLQGRTLALKSKSTFKIIKDYEGRPGEDLVREWERCQDGQSILVTTPSVLVGYRVQVYRAEGYSHQWYTAVIVGYNEATRELTVTDDTVLENRSEDPSLLHMRLIGDGVIESIMRGENVGMTPRRSRSNLVLHKQTVRGRRGTKGRTPPADPVAAQPPSQPPDRGKKKTPDKQKTTGRGKNRRSLRKLRTPSPEKRERVLKTRSSSRKPGDKTKSKENRGKKGRASPTGGRKAVRKKPEEEIIRNNVELELTDDLNKEEQETDTPQIELRVEQEEDEGAEEDEEEEREDEEENVVEEDGGEVTGDTQQQSSPLVDHEVNPQQPASPFRMDDGGNSGVVRDDRSVDSGVSSLRSSGGSSSSSSSTSSSSSVVIGSTATGTTITPGDERSSANSITEEQPPKPATPTIKPSTPTPQVWRDPSVVGEVRHVESPQHCRLVMSGAPSYGGGAAELHHQHGGPPLLHPQVPSYGAAAAVAAAAQLWAKRYPGMPPVPPSLHPDPHLQAAVTADRIIRDRREQEVRELEKQQKEKQERDRLERERQDREKLEKQRAAEQAVHKHFEESLRLAQQKQAQAAAAAAAAQQQQHQQQRSAMGWSSLGTLSSGAHISRLEEKNVQQVVGHPPQDRLREMQRQEMHRQELQRQEMQRQELRPTAYYTSQPSSMQVRKVDYPPPAHHKAPGRQDKQSVPHLPKAEPNFNIYPGYHPNPYHSAATLSLAQQPKAETKPTYVVGTKQMEVQSHVSDLKNSVIVKNDKTVLHSSPSPKQYSHSQAPPLAKSPCDYRYLEAGNNMASISKVHPSAVHQVSVSRSNQHMARSSPLPQARHSQSPHRLSPQVVYQSKQPPQATVTSYPYPVTASAYRPRPCPSPQTKPKPVPSKAPLTPSPYQQLSQHNLPPPVSPAPAVGQTPPPVAHAHTVRPAFTPPLDSQCFQTQPLDLNISSSIKEEPLSPKKRSLDAPEDLDVKKIKVEVKLEDDRPPSVGTAPAAVTPPVMERVSPAPPAPTPSPAPPAPSPDRPTTPLQDDKASSPRPSYPVHKLKKAWLQRHSGEDTTTDTKPCVPPPPITPPSPSPVKKEQPVVVNSLHSIGSMAVNSISKKPKVSRKSKELNGHVTSKTPDVDDSSSSDPERKSSPLKRVPPKVKRKKGGGRKTNATPDDAKRKKTSASSTDSDKESVSDKDSDTGAAAKKKEEKAVIKKRGRKPKTQSKNGDDEESRKKDEDSPARDSLSKPSVGQLKKSGESFLQDGPCFEVAPKLAKCRECRLTPHQRSKNMPNIFCRFYAFRRLRYTKNGQLAIAGFSDPHRDASQDDIKLWLPLTETTPQCLDVEMSRFLLTQVGDQFCDLLQQEKEANTIHMSEDKTVAWKRVVQGVREMCDVCETTLFNLHWACSKCGFVVCIDCYKSRRNGTINSWEGSKEKDQLDWLVCTNRQPHEPEKLMLTQIIAGDSLARLGRLVHEARIQWGIPMYCSCVNPPNGVKDPKKKEVNGSVKEGDSKTDSLRWLADVALSSEGSGDSEPGLSTLRQLLIRPNGTTGDPGSPVWAKVKSGCSNLETLDEVISSVIEHSVPQPQPKLPELKHFVRRYSRAIKGRDPMPIRVMTLTESQGIYNDVPHSWLCDGKLLRLLDSKHPNNYKIFQDQWKRGQPVLVSDVTKDLTNDLWTPESFNRDFGDTRNDLVDCLTGTTLHNQPMRKFWEGFSLINKRIKDDDGNPLVLKLKDWPAGDDFADLLPSRFNDLMKVLPLGEYTQRNGRLNLASRLPECFVRPDLGPKMYTAYGLTGQAAASTNLHLDISDAVNVMVYVGIPTDMEYDQAVKEVLKAVDEAGCDMLTRRRVREKEQLPGALWHIYMARDADKIRDLLNKVALEKGGELEPHHDPIHDQSWYLDHSLRDRLYKEYGVEGYTIVQCLGDAVFIPAGAPHQVKNLHNCIKVAEDFVSPENVSHCFNLTQEFRDLTDTHTNHEDKLQIKNIMYHAVKDSLGVLSNNKPYPEPRQDETQHSDNMEKQQAQELQTPTPPPTPS